MRTRNNRYKTKTWNGRTKSWVTWNNRLKTHYSPGIRSPKVHRIARKGKWVKSQWHKKGSGYKRQRYFKKAWA